MQLHHLCCPSGQYWWFNFYPERIHKMDTVKIIFDNKGFWHVYRTDRYTGQRSISFFQNVDEAKASLLK